MRVGFVSRGIAHSQPMTQCFCGSLRPGAGLWSFTNQRIKYQWPSRASKSWEPQRCGWSRQRLLVRARLNIDYSLTTYFPSGAIAGSSDVRLSILRQWDQRLINPSRLLINPQELNVPGGNRVLYCLTRVTISHGSARTVEGLLAVTLASMCCIVFRLRRSSMAAPEEMARQDDNGLRQSTIRQRKKRGQASLPDPHRKQP